MNRDKTYLQDIIKAIEKINSYIKDNDFSSFQNNYMMQDAIIRNLELIGEASRRLSIEFEQNYPEYPYAETVGMRNVLIHEYDKIDLQRTWDTIQTDLPNLKKYIEAIISKI
jgi:uncharacterized protein with HEPN domain